jgi:exodeoxyribonuclease-3
MKNVRSIVSYNVNGLRAAIGKGLWEWLEAERPDVLCLQEIKAQPEDVPLLELEALGYRHYWRPAEKKGYSGVATFSLQPSDHVVYACGIEAYDREGRILRTDFGEWTLLNCYFPSGTTGEERQAFKMVFLDKFYEYALELKKERPNLIIVGDYNIAHQEIDIHDPKGNKKSSGFLPEERAWMSKWLESGFTDAFRYKNPELAEYSWWTFRAGARGKNKGWRIDYQSVSDPLKDKIVSVNQLTSVMHSDHCPVKMVIDL